MAHPAFKVGQGGGGSAALVALKSGRVQMAERLCQVTPLVLWRKALERSSMGLPQRAAGPDAGEEESDEHHLLGFCGSAGLSR